MDLRSQLESMEHIETEKVSMLENINNLIDEKNEQEHFIRETMIRL